MPMTTTPQAAKQSVRAELARIGYSYPPWFRNSAHLFLIHGVTMTLCFTIGYVLALLF